MKWKLSQLLMTKWYFGKNLKKIGFFSDHLHAFVLLYSMTGNIMVDTKNYRTTERGEKERRFENERKI
jgi:hypothetical protein